MVSEKSRLVSLVSMIRPANSIMVGFAVVVGVAVTSHSASVLFSVKTLLGFLTGFFVSSFSMVSNDYYDLEVDRINQPSRPLVSGVVSLERAKIFAATLLVLGLLASIPLGVANVAIATIFGFIGWYYNAQGKKHGLFGNSLVALSLAIPYVYGSILLGNYAVNLGYLLALTSFLAGMGREVLKGMADVSGDRVRNIRSVALLYGTSTAKAVTAFLFLSAVISSVFPIAFGLLGSAFYLYVILILIPDAIFVYLAIRVLLIRREEESLKLKSVALGGMMAGLLAYLISGLAV